MVKNKETNKQQQNQETDWSTVKVEDLVKRLNKVEEENAELKKYLGVLEDRLNNLETSKKPPADKPSMTFEEFISRLTRVEEENAKLRSMLQVLEARIATLEGKPAESKPAEKKPVETKPVEAKPAEAKPVEVKPAEVPAKKVETPAKKQETSKPEAAKPANNKKKDKKNKEEQPKAQPAPAAKKNDDDFDLFGEDDKDAAEKTKVLEDRLHAYQALKANKPKVIAKSSVLLDVKVWDDTTDMVALEKAVRDIQMDGLVWGQSKLVPVAYSVKKLQIACVIEDDKVSTDALEEKITALEDYVQSVDIAAFNKI